MAQKSVVVTDLSGMEIADVNQSATATIRFGDGRRGIVVADAHIDDKIIPEITKVGSQQSRRARPRSRRPDQRP